MEDEEDRANMVVVLSSECVCWHSLLYDLTNSVVRIQGLALSIGPNRVGVFYLMTETQSSLRNVVCFNQKQTMNNIQQVCHIRNNRCLFWKS
jgi:hypothetical protein